MTYDEFKSKVSEAVKPKEEKPKYKKVVVFGKTLADARRARGANYMEQVSYKSIEEHDADEVKDFDEVVFAAGCKLNDVQL